MEKPDPIAENPDNGEEEEEDDLDDDEDDLEPEPEPLNPRARESQARVEREKVENLIRRMQTETVPLRVHDVIIKGNVKTKDSILESETALLKDVSSMQELLEASKVVNFRLQALEVFDSVRITLDSGPSELAGTANVVVEVVESKSPVSCEVGAYTKGEARSSTVEGTLKYKNLFGYGDLWDSSVAYGGDHMTEVSAGVYVPRFKGRVTPLTARLFLLSQDWLRFSSYKERSLGLSLGLVSSRNHDLVYNLAWRTLTDPSQMASRSIRRQLGHGLLSSLKYTFKVDQRNSPLRPTHGYAFVSTTQVGGLAPDSRSLRFLRQELDLRCAIPLGFLRSALNLGISVGVVFPWGTGFSNMPSPLPERFFVGGNLSPVCTLGGPMAFYGFRTRGLGPTEPRRQLQSNSTDDSADPGRDYLGGDLAVTAFADLSFDFPSKWCQAKGIHGHVFASAGNVDKLTENAYRNFSLQKFVESSRSTVGVGIVVPTNLFRLELNYCFILKKFEYERGKSGFRVSFSTPS
ncbi:sorting and assembly machinery (sam50) protein, putative [Ricinus communis]|uniref:Sorting and assembly machinery (Sam50) protein, putative n=1 Tax=Ricinus communis TaxID=3988 RepID=B9SQQ8_RICCO|nr:sorting and assembly machinery (sam50) protein, putative [Ricinus communis]|eukprot:XP_002528327.1 sorting and assembly machinery component 50 homolog B [Ricinus communis]